MTEFVNLYLGEPTDSVLDNDFFKRVELVDAKPTDAPADIPKHYNVEVTVKTREDEKYRTEINSRTINNWLTRFEPVLREELEGDEGLDGEYRGKERNAVTIEVLMSIVGSWINTEKAEKVN